MVSGLVLGESVPKKKKPNGKADNPPAREGKSQEMDEALSAKLSWILIVLRTISNQLGRIACVLSESSDLILPSEIEAIAEKYPVRAYEV